MFYRSQNIAQISEELISSFVTQGLKASRLSLLAVLFNHILYCICFKILSTESKYLVST